MKTSDQYQHLLTSKGISLDAVGVRDIGLERVDALIAIEFLRNDSIPILGGDVYIKDDAAIELAYANWHSDPKAGETKEDYLKRSLSSAEKYIQFYPEPINGRPLFVIVIGD